MSANVNANVLRNFIVKTIGGDKLANDKTQNYDINNNEFEEADENDNNWLEIDEILENDDLYEKFATLFVEEQDEKKAEEKDAEKEKEEKNKVKDKNGTGAA